MLKIKSIQKFSLKYKNDEIFYFKKSLLYTSATGVPYFLAKNIFLRS